MKRVLTIALICAVLFSTALPALAYSDVPSGSWYYGPINELASKNLISGYPDGTFRPDSSITRAEFAAIMCKALGLATANASFSDAAGHWAQAYIGGIATAGVMNGYPDNTFKPNNKITRAEIASTLVRAYVFGATRGEYTWFTDTWDHWAEENIRIANQNGIIGGYPGDIFKPNAQATRAEASAMISRAIFAFEPIDASLGQSKTSGSIQLTASNWKTESSIYDSSLDYSWEPPAGAHFVSVDVTLKNIGADAVGVNKFGFALHLSNGKTIDPDIDYYDGVDLRDLVTNASESGTVTFSVPTNATIAYISYDYEGVKFPIKITQ